MAGGASTVKGGWEKKSARFTGAVVVGVYKKIHPRCCGGNRGGVGGGVCIGCETLLGGANQRRRLFLVDCGKGVVRNAGTMTQGFTYW